MARMRSLKPEFWDDRKLARATSRDARMLYMGLWNYSDEHGRCNGDPVWLKGRIFPFEDDITPDVIGGLLRELANCHRIQRYTVDGDPYLFLGKLDKHQRLDTKVESRLPPPPPAGTDEPEPDPDPSESRADESGPRADSSEEVVTKHVAGSREHVAGSREHVPASPAGDDAPARTEGQRVNDLTKRYTDHPNIAGMARFPAIAAIVRRAVRSGRYDDPAIADALERLAAEGRPVTVETLRVELDGLPPPRTAASRAPTPDERVAAIQALKHPAGGTVLELPRSLP